ncbi:hypothetical protein [Microbulbifer litoralis]|uniref:hypothetical protein n=1 Tax=Microbulbifer litoralis TaxID=2933965 RepID=UPI002027B100|nr:hypothetical protein [Microbulbifer sp. GX H0434]
MQRREPTLDGSSAPIEPQLDTRPGGRSAARPAAPPPEPVEERSGGGSSFLAVAALILALAGIGAAAFLYNQWQATRVELLDADKRIAQLEKRFEMSDEESSASVEVLNAKAKENASEIRKLWGVSYDTNRKSIAANKSAAASAAKDAAAVKKEVAALAGKVNGLSGSVKKIGAVEMQLAQLRESNTENQRDVADKLARLERQLASVRSDLTARVGANEEAIESVDAYRRSVNKDLVQLRDAIRSLQSSGSTASSM